MRKIKLTQGKYALVDNEDYEFLNQWKWNYWKNQSGTVGYAVRSIKVAPLKRIEIRMHCIIFGGKYVDHVNGNGIDNRRKNLRKATRSQNQCNRGIHKNNTSGYKGVSRLGKLWRATICYKTEAHYLGAFPTREMAYKAYVKAAKGLHGEFARWK